MNKTKTIYYDMKYKNMDYIVLIKCGNFYRTYGEDALILWSIFDYTIKDDSVGFPINIVMKVIHKLSSLGIYLELYDNSQSIYDYCLETPNTYDKYLKIAGEKLELSSRINEIVEKVSILVNSDNNNAKIIMDFLNDM